MTARTPHGSRSYLTNHAGLSKYTPFMGDLMSGSFMVDQMTLSRDLLDRGWLLCVTENTETHYFVKPRRNKRYLKAWDCYVTDFDIREVDTVVNSDCAIVAALGDKIPGMPKVYSRIEILEDFDLMAKR